MSIHTSTIGRRFFARPESLMLAALTAAAITLVAAAVIGGRHAGASTSGLSTNPSPTGPSNTTNTPGVSGLVNGPAVGPQSTAGATVKPGASGGGSRTAAVPGGLTKAGERGSSIGATRVGVHKDYFEFAVHGPVTDDGVPWGLADPTVAGLKGYVTYINRHGGINGLKARLYLADDRYTTAGARQVGDTLVKEVKPFLIEGTLGIDQIQKVALASHGSGIPYLAGGGPEPELKSIGMYQEYTSYDEDVRGLAKYICKYGKSYVGENEVRLGTSTLNSELILPVEKRFVQILTTNHCIHTPVDANARGTINKPTEQSTYSDELSKFRGAYGGKGVNLIVPLQDPLSTSRMVAEQTSYKGPTYNPKWTFVNFAHDGDTDYKLMQGQWIGVRGLSPACYFAPAGGGQPYNPKLCAAMGEAHREFVSLGNVTYDANAGGNQGGHSSYTYQEGNATSDGWTKDGAGAAFGYSTVYSWVGAMKAIGADPTREKFLAALNLYDNYSNLITGPISFRGSANHMIGANKFVVLEGTAQQRYRQVTDITPGLVDHF